MWCRPAGARDKFEEQIASENVRSHGVLVDDIRNELVDHREHFTQVLKTMAQRQEETYKVLTSCIAIVHSEVPKVPPETENHSNGLPDSIGSAKEPLQEVARRQEHLIQTLLFQSHRLETIADRSREVLDSLGASAVPMDIARRYSHKPSPKKCRSRDFSTNDSCATHPASATSPKVRDPSVSLSPTGSSVSGSPRQGTAARGSVFSVKQWAKSAFGDRTSKRMFGSGPPIAATTQKTCRPDVLDEERRKAAHQKHLENQTKMLQSSISAMTLDRKRNFMQRMVDSNWFELFFAAAIVTNSFFVGLQVEYSVSKRTNKIPSSFYVIQYVYAFLFTVEICLRIAAVRWKFFKLDGSHSLWNYLDIFIVSSTVFESVMDTLYLTTQSMDDEGSGITSSASNARIIRILRIARLMRIIRVARILRFIHALRTFIYSIIATLKSLVWALVLLFMILYVFGIVFTQTAGDWLIDYTETHAADSTTLSLSSNTPTSLSFLIDRYWGSLPRSIFTLFKSISGGVSWDDVVHPISEFGGLWVAVFTFYISFTYFAVLNVVTGIFCQSAIETAQNNEDLMVQAQIASKELYVTRIRKLFNELDDDGSGSLTIAELEAHLLDDNVQAVFSSMDISTTDAWTLFKMLASEEGCEVNGEEFVEGLMRLKGNAKRADFVELHVLIKRLDVSSHSLLSMVEDLDHKLAKVTGFCQTKLFMDREKSKQEAKLSKTVALSKESTQSTTDEVPPGKELSNMLQPELWQASLVTMVKSKRHSPRLDACCGDNGSVNTTSLEDESDPLERKDGF